MAGNNSGAVYRAYGADPETGDAFTPVNIEGAQGIFPQGEPLYRSGPDDALMGSAQPGDAPIIAQLQAQVAELTECNQRQTTRLVEQDREFGKLYSREQRLRHLGHYQHMIGMAQGALGTGKRAGLEQAVRLLIGVVQQMVNERGDLDD